MKALSDKYYGTSACAEVTDRKDSTMHNNQHTTSKRLTAYDREYLDWYTRYNDTTGIPFDPTLLVDAVRKQHRNKPQWATAFALCTRRWDRNELYTYFLSPPDKRARWNYVGGFELEHPVMGTILVDLIRDPNGPGGIAIGGVEWLDVVMGYRDSTGAIMSKPTRPHHSV